MFRWLVSLLPRRERSVEERALSELDRGDPAAAEQLISSLLEAEPFHGARAFLLNKRGVARAKQGHREAAASDFRAALEDDPKHTPAVVNLANLAFESGNIEDAQRQYRVALELDPEEARAYAGLAAVYNVTGKRAEAAHALKTAQRLSQRRTIFSRAIRRS
jgi:predicted Zn-dependent protease